jgi:hypothetical protein
VVEVPVGEDDPARTAPRIDRVEHRRDVLAEVGPGVDDPARIAADEPRVRALERVRRRVVRAQQLDVVGGEDAAED